MAEIGYTRNLFLRGICVVYLFAFLSLYVQIPGLYGNNGISPARIQMLGPNSRSLSEKIHQKPTLLWFAPFLGLNVEYMMDVLSLIGIFLSFTGFVSQKFCTAPIFGALWSLYYSLFQVGQSFMSSKWDILLLEVGFLSILVAPWKYQFNLKQKQQVASPTDSVRFFLVRWLLFRLLFATGAFKLRSNCSSWWNLSALSVYFESQPLPTMLSWYCHHLPTWFLKLVTVFSLVVEQIMPFLFFFPLRSVRIFGFFIQVFLQVCVIISGNYNFLNFLTIILCLSLLDDQFFLKKKDNSTPLRKFLGVFVNILVHGFVIYIAVVYYSLRLTPEWTVESKIAFTLTDFDHFLKRAVPAGIYVAGITLLILSVQAVYNSLKGAHAKITTFLGTLFYISAAFFLFGISVVPHWVLHRPTSYTIMPPLRELYGRIENLQIANSYTMFRCLGGDTGRLEIVIEGSNQREGPWREYYFKYKPGDVNASLPFVAPHQPRLDWQMWEATAGAYYNSTWMMSAVYRIMEGEKSVIGLLDTNRLPFSKPPKYIRGTLYHYHYTKWSERKLPAWWKRASVEPYFPAFSLNHGNLLEDLKKSRIIESKEILEADNKLVYPLFKVVLDALRTSVGHVDPVLLIWSVFTAGLAIILTTSAVSKDSHSAPEKPSKSKSGRNY